MSQHPMWVPEDVDKQPPVNIEIGDVLWVEPITYRLPTQPNGFPFRVTVLRGLGGDGYMYVAGDCLDQWTGEITQPGTTVAIRRLHRRARQVPQEATSCHPTPGGNQVPAGYRQVQFQKQGGNWR